MSLPSLIDATHDWDRLEAQIEDGADWWSELAAQAAWEIERISWAKPRSGLSAHVDGLVFKAIVNTQVKFEFCPPPPDEFVIATDFSEFAQQSLARRVKAAFVAYCHELQDARNIVWRHRPEWRRILAPDGLRIQLYARLAWVDGP